MADNKDHALQDPSTQRTDMKWSDDVKNNMNKVVNNFLTRYTPPKDQWRNIVKVLHPWWLAKLCKDKEGGHPSPETDIEQKLMVCLPTFGLRYDRSMYVLHAELNILNTINYLKSLKLRTNVSHVEFKIDDSGTTPQILFLDWPKEESTEYIFHLLIKMDENTSHANVAYLIKDRTSKKYTMYYYEPHGNVQFDAMKQTFLEEVEKKLPDLNFHIVAIGFDRGNMQETFANITEISEPGFCLYFCTHWLMQVMILLNVLENKDDVEHGIIEYIEKYNLTTYSAYDLYDRIVAIVHNVVNYTRESELNKDDEKTNYYNHSVPDRFKEQLVRVYDVVPLKTFYSKMLDLYRIDVATLTNFLIDNTISTEKVDVKDDKIYNQPPFLTTVDADLDINKIETDIDTLKHVSEQYMKKIKDINETKEINRLLEEQYKKYLEEKEERHRLSTKKRKMPLKIKESTMNKRYKDALENDLEELDIVDWSLKNFHL